MCFSTISSYEFFLTFTCNQAECFGVSIIKSWIDGGKWQANLKNFKNLKSFEKEDIKTALDYFAAFLFVKAMDRN